MKRVYKSAFPIFVFLLGIINTSSAQELSTEGKTFWMTFMETVGGFGCSDKSAPELKIVISCNKATTGTVKNIITGHTRNFSIGVGGGVDTLLIPSYMGYTTGTESASDRSRGILIEANDTITVSAQNTKQYSCDASLIYPIEALGVDYRILTHMGDQSGSNSCYKSSFAIVATEDNTSIDITPTVATSGGKSANTTFTITLNKGETYQVLSSTNKNDLSGTLIQAKNCKKIAVFGGSIRSSVLYSANSSCASSYDHLYEEMMPINIWGKKFVCIPTLYSKGKQRKADMIKVVSNSNSCFVRCNGRGKLLSVAGQWDTFYITSNAVVTANKAIAVCQFGLSEDCDKVGGGGTNTDPMMIWVPPVEQSLKKLSFSCEVALQVNKFFLNVVVKTSYTSTFTLDGATPAATWKPIAQDTAYSFIQQDGLSVGKHRMACPYGFSAVLYAYGDHASYGYNAGSSVKPLSFYMTAAGKSSADFELDTPYYVVCQGTVIPFDVTASYIPTGWKWLINNPSGLVIKTSKFFNYTFLDTGFIKVRAVTTRPLSGVCNGISTDTLTQYVKVFGKPKIKLLNDTLICRGTSFYITSKTDGDTNYTFSPNTWLSCSKCYKPLCSPLMDTTYAVVATTKGCLPSRDTFKVMVRDSLFLFKGNDTLICRGTSTTLKAWAKGGLVSGQTITWDNGLGTGLSKVVAPKVTTTYRMILTDGCTKNGKGGLYADTNYIKVSVYDSLKITMPRDTTVCEGNIVTLTPVIKGGRTGTSLVTWDNGLGTGFTKSITTTSLTVTYKAVLSDGCTNPKDSGYVKITVRPGLKVDTILYSTPVCRNTIFKVNIKLSGGDSTGYRIKLLNATLPGPPVVIDSFKNTAYPFFNIKIQDDSKFKISFTQTCNSHTPPLKQFDVKIKKALNIVSTLPVDTICTGQSYDILATGGSPENLPIKFILKRKNGAAYIPIDSMTDIANAKFKVTPVGIQTDYLIIGDDKCNRNDSDIFRLMVRPPMALTKLIDDELCRGESISYTGSAFGGKSQNITYTWTDASNGTLLGSNKSVTVTPTTSMDIALLVDDGCSKPIRDTARVYISPVVSDSILVESDTMGCQPYSTIFKFPTTLSQPINPKFSWTWYFNGALSTTTPSIGGQNTHPDIPKAYNTANLYDGKVELVMPGGKVCNSYTRTIDVWPQAIAGFDYSPKLIDIIEPIVTFSNQSTGATDYYWDFGDGKGLSQDKDPIYVYTDTGSYDVVLIATNVNGCADTTIAKRLTVLDIFRIWIPNAFSPNADDFNSLWIPNVTSIEKMEFEIFNRWGEEVFKSDGKLQWNGQYGNQPNVPVPEGIYYYHIKVRDNRKKWHYYNGTLTLLR